MERYSLPTMTRVNVIHSQMNLQKRQRHPSQTASRQENTSQLSEEVWHSTAGRRVPLIPGVDQETKPLTADEIQSGVQSIKEVFPEVHQTVAELTLKVCCSISVFAARNGNLHDNIQELLMTAIWSENFAQKPGFGLA